MSGRHESDRRVPLVAGEDAALVRVEHLGRLGGEPVEHDAAVAAVPQQVDLGHRRDGEVTARARRVAP
jgi:hypothetical protein